MKKLLATVFAVTFLIIGLTSTSEAATKTGWFSAKGHWYFYTQSGSPYKGWLKSGNKWYYLDNTGVMKTGWIKVSNKWYFLDPTGAMKTGWSYSGGKWYYLNSSGAMQTGWQTIAGKQYYFYPSGAMAINTTVNGQTIGSDGAVVQKSTVSELDKALSDLKAFGATVKVLTEDSQFFDKYTTYVMYKGSEQIGSLEVGYDANEHYNLYQMDLEGQYSALGTQLALDLGYNATAEEIKGLIDYQVSKSTVGGFLLSWNESQVKLTLSPQVTKAINDMASAGAVAKVKMSNEGSTQFDFNIFKNNQYVGQIDHLYTQNQYEIDGNIQYTDLLEKAALDLGINCTSDALKTSVQKAISDPSYVDPNPNSAYTVYYLVTTKEIDISWHQ